MSSVEVSGPYQSAGTLLTNTNKTDVLACPDGHTYVVTGINICMISGGPGTADIIRYDGAVEVYLRYQSVVPAAGSLDIEFRPIVLRKNHILRVKGANNQHVDVSFMSIRNSPEAAARM